MPYFDISKENLELENELNTLFKKGDSNLLNFLNYEAIDGISYIEIGNLERGILNARFWQLLGYDLDNLPEKNNAWLELMVAEDSSTIRQTLHKNISSSNARFDHHVRFNHVDGDLVTLRCKGLILHDEQGNANRMIGLHTDLSRERHIELLLTETNRAARVGSWEYNVIKNKVFWSEITKEIHETPPGFMASIDQGVSFYKEGYSKDRISEVLAKALEVGTPWDEVLQIVTAKGNHTWVRSVGQASIVNGKVVRLYGSFQDVTDKTIKELELQEKEELLRQNFELAPNGMVITDADGTFERVSKSFCKMIGYSRNELLKMNLLSITHPDYLESNSTMMAGFIANKFDSHREEKRYLTKQGNIVWADVSIAVLRDSEKKPKNYHIQLVDITNARVAESRRQRIAFLEAKAKEMEQFAYIASHDLRQPVLTLQGYLTALKEDFGASLSEDGEGYLKVMHGALSRMDEMIKGLLDYSRLSKLKQLQKVDLDVIIQQVLDDLTSQINENNATIKFSSIGTIQGYPVELRQLFQNLISNALRYRKLDTPPIVSITVSEIPGGRKFCIKDNGIGIKKENQQRIFGLFQTAERTERSGTGIGLASCKTIVERHGGTIWVESKFGKGSSFYFTVGTE